MVENKYYCQNCNAEIKSTDTVCPKCGKNLKEVGRRVEVTVTETIGFSADAILSKEQENLIKKVIRAIRKELDKKEIESVTFGFPQLVSVKIKNKKVEIKKAKEK